MKKSCCIEKGGICSESSGSMVLRSACSHRHSPISKKVKGTNILESTPIPRLRDDETSQVIIRSREQNNLQISSILQTSFKGFAFKSAEESYFLSKDASSSLESTREDSFTIHEASSVNSKSAKEQICNRISLFSDSHLKDSFRRKEKCSDYSSGAESDLSKSFSNDIPWKMSRTQRSTRSSTSRRALSDTDSEEESYTQRNSITRSQNADLDSNINLVSTNYGLFNRGTQNHNHLSSNPQVMSRSSLTRSNNNMHQHSEGVPETNRRLYFPESPQLNVSDVQYSYFDRARWFIWKCIYLKIVKNMSFDVWSVSRLNVFGKSKAALMLLLPFLLFVIWGSTQEEWQCCIAPYKEAVNNGFHSIDTYFTSCLSSLRSLPNYPSHQEQVTSPTDDGEKTCSSPPPETYLFSALYSMFSGLFHKSSEDPTSNHKSSEDPASNRISSERSTGSHEHSQVLPVNEINKEEMRVLAIEILTEESQNVLRNFEMSFSHLANNVEKKENEYNFRMEIDDLRQEVKAFKERIEKLEENIKLNLQRTEKLETSDQFASDLRENVDSVSANLKIIEEKIEALGQLKKCCDQKWNADNLLASIEISLIAALKKVIKSESEDNAEYRFFNDWLNSKFVNQGTMSEEIKLAVQKLKAEHKTSRHSMEKIMESLVLQHVEAMKANLTLTNTAQDLGSTTISEIFSEDNVKKMIKEALSIYDADKTGKADYALESAGGSIIGTRCSEPYAEKSGKFSIFGVPLWSFSTSPRTVIQPGMQPGQCWAFKGSQGFLVLELSSVIYPSGFTLEHIPISLSPTESIDSAPKEFSVWGLLSEEDNSGKMLGKYLYDIKGDPLQYFPIQNFIGEPFQYLELKIHNNHGNMDYTCLYRFRVHGKRAR